MDHSDRTQGHRTERRIPRRHRPRHRAGQFREVFCLGGARAGSGDRHAPPRRHAARPLSACRRDDREELQDRAGKPAAGIRTGPYHVPPDQPDRRQGPGDLLARVDQLPDRDRRRDDHIGGAGRLARTDRHPDFGSRPVRTRHRRPAVPGRPQAVATAPRLAAAADTGKTAPRHRRQQHDAGPAAVRFVAAPRHLQPALYRDVRPVGRCHQAGLQFPRRDRPPRGNRIVRWRRRPLCRTGAARHRAAQRHGDHDARRTLGPGRQRAAGGRRMGGDP